MKSILEQVKTYYHQKFDEHGATPRGVDWNSVESQELRFSRLLISLGSNRDSVLDYGCGYGALLSFLRRNGFEGSYTGFDLVEGSLQFASKSSPDANWVSDRSLLKPCDYVIASGVFNVKMSTTASDWKEYIFSTLKDMDSLALKGLAFNCLTAYSDQDRMRSDLYYAQPEEIFSFCMKNFGRKVSLLHDYPLYEFTIVVRKIT